MDRRGFLQAGGAAAVAAGAAPARATANLAASGEDTRLPPPLGARVLTLALAPGYDLPGFAADRLANRIAVATGGRFRIERADAAAACDLSFGDAHRLSALHPGFAFFAGLPGGAGLPSADLDAWLVVGGGQLLWDELARPFGLKPLVAGRTGEPAGLWSNVRLEQVADLAGLPVAAAGMAAPRVLARLGATPIDVAPQDLRAALASGELGAAEWAGPLPAVAFDLGPVAQRLYQPGLNRGGARIVLSVERGLWDALSAADQAIFEACAAQEYRLQLAEAKFYASMAPARPAAKWPLRTGLPAPVAEALAKATRAVVAELAGHDQSCRRIWASYEAYHRWRGVA